MNKVILIGRLARDPDLRYTQQKNTAFCKFTLAVNKRKKDEGADFFNCIAWDKQAELISKYVQKGSQISIIGRLQQRSWDNEDGKKQNTIEIVTEEIYFIGSAQTKPQDEQSEFDMNEDELPF
jgi:single-strand DNA-binding protein